ncbi:PDZ domain-containing protein [Rhodocytophaga aerolata]|uniref:PDZ domain-containing protein n=1 Tax=Rhodocytophaga aerolata TaxID=455078 RepID=A0ABT8RD45_9BACT|nr:PDZ domain-containing protein [Rhodocytophaga aerolata]MDO1450018.1 PDZ domain-containing protein [Rhodocytophaga aerolata]
MHLRLTSVFTQSFRSSWYIVLLVLLAQAAWSQQKTSYEISFENAVHHEAHIQVTFSGLPTKPLEVLMSRSSPGRYALHEFAKHVYALEARNSKGQVLAVTRPTPYEWNIAKHDGTVTITYTLFGNRADGTYTGITALFAHLNMPATFLWARGLENKPMEVSFKLPEGKNWKIATQLKPGANPSTFSAPHLQYFMDSPTLVGNFIQRKWQVLDGSKTRTLQLAIFNDGPETVVDEFTQKLQQVVLELRAVFGELPEYEYGQYTFLGSYMPYVSGDGMEHRNSTMISGPSGLQNHLVPYLNTAAHEFFHSWNVERLRPRSLEPFDFERANMSGELWFAEGFTSYYGDLAVKRTEAISLEDYAGDLGANLNFMLNAPGRQLFSAIEMSQQAPFVDAAVSIEPNNRRNTYLSYYTFGNMLGLALDLTLRKEFNNISLDDYMRRLWKKYGKEEKPYTLQDLKTTLGELTGNQNFANSFFSSYIEGKETAPYQALLAQAGLQLQKAYAGKASLGLESFKFTSQGATVGATVLRGGPLYKAGLESGDIITHLNGNVFTAEAYQDLQAEKKPGDEVSIRYIQMGTPKEGKVTLIEDPTWQVVTYEEINLPITTQITNFRQNWLASKAKQK